MLHPHASPHATRSSSARGRSFGECLGSCFFNVTIDASDDGACDVAALTICQSDGIDCREPQRGTLTPAGHARARELAAALVGVSLMPVYGCPDCADGGASFATIRRAGSESEHSWEFSNAPSVLTDVDTFVQGLVDTLRTCTSNEHVDVAPECVPDAV